jgi:hypothetical protein
MTFPPPTQVVGPAVQPKRNSRPRRFEQLIAIFVVTPKISQCTAYEKTILACASSSLGTKDTSRFMGLKANKKPGSHTKSAGYLVMLMC